MPGTILRPYLLSFKHRLDPVRSGNQRRNRDRLLLAVALIVMSCIFVGLVLIFHNISDNPFFTKVIPPKIIELLSYTFLVLLILSNTVAVIGNVYVADNMNLLLTAPLSPSRLFAAKSLETLFETCIMLVVFLLPAALAYYVTFPVGLVFLGLGVLVALPFAALTLGIAVVIATVFMNLITYIWKRGALFLLAALVAGIWGLVRLLNMIAEAKLQSGGAYAAVQFLGLFDNPSPSWLPSRWAGDILSSFVDNNQVDVGLKLFLLYASAAASLSLGYLFFDLFALRVRSIATSLHQLRTTNSTKGRDIARDLLESIYFSLPIEQQTRAMILKDLSSLLRDHGQAIHLLLYTGIASLYVINFRFLSAAWYIGDIAQRVWMGVLGGINILFAGFMLTALMTRLVYPSVSLEGRAFWILQVSPISIPKLIRAKFWCWLPVTTIISLSLLLSGAAAIGVGLDVLLATLVVGIFTSVGFTGLAVGVGAQYASFDWESPSQIAVGLGTLVLLLSGVVFVLVLAVPTCTLTFLITVPETMNYLGAGAYFALISGCLFAILLVNFLVAKAACTKGAQSLAKVSLG